MTVRGHYIDSDTDTVVFETTSKSYDSETTYTAASPRIFSIKVAASSDTIIGGNYYLVKKSNYNAGLSRVVFFLAVILDHKIDTAILVSEGSQTCGQLTYVNQYPQGYIYQGSVLSGKATDHADITETDTYTGKDEDNSILSDTLTMIGNTPLIKQAVNKKLYAEEDLMLAANAIRLQTNVDKTYKVKELAAAIKALPVVSDSVCWQENSWTQSSQATDTTGCSYPDNITLHGPYKFIAQNMFEGITASTITVPNTVVSVGAEAFENANISSLAFPEGLKEIQVDAFSGAALFDFSLPTSLEKISNNAFYQAEFQTGSFIFPQTTTPLALGDGCFKEASFKELTLPNNLTMIPVECFRGTSIKELTVPASLIDIKPMSFADCTSLAKVTFKGTPTTLESSAFNGDTALKDIYVPWAENAVSNAPWGATAATIHYNTAA